MTKTTTSPPWLLYLSLMGLSLLVLSACSRNDQGEAKPVEEKRVSVHATKTEKGDIQSWVFAEGTARSVAREYMMFKEPGNIIFIKPGLREGSIIEAGTVLARQDQRSLKADMTEAETAIDVAKSELEQAKTQAVLAQKTFNRYAKLLKQQSASQQEYDEAKAKADNAKADISRAQNNIAASQARRDQINVRMEDSELIAPMDGMVAYLNIEQGFYFMPSIVRTDSEESALNTVPIVMIDPAAYEIAVDIPVYDRDRVKIGQTVLIQTRQSQAQRQPSSADDQMPSQEALTKNRTGQSPPQGLDANDYIRGEVYSVNPAVSPSGRSIQVEIRTHDKEMTLKDGMYVTVWIATEHQEGVVTAPLDAFLYRDNQPFVFTVEPQNSTAQLRQVTLGLQGFNRREVRSGVASDVWIVTEGRYQLSHGTKVKILGQEMPLSKAVSHDER